MKNKYLEDIELILGLSPTTVKNYTTWLNTISSFNQEKPLEKINYETVNNFISHMKKNSCDPKTINLHLIVLRLFLKYCNLRGVATILPDKIKSLPVNDKELVIPRESEIKKIFNIELPDREKALIELLFSTGLRIKELKQLRIENIEWEKKSITILGKGGRVRLVFLSERAIMAAKKHIADRTSGFLFKESIRTLQRIITSLTKKAGIKSRVTCHMIRHIFATDLLKNGADIYDVKKFLGHSNVATTERYLHVTNEDLAEKFTKFHATTRE